jgi:hypothetical protein
LFQRLKGHHRLAGEDQRRGIGGVHREAGGATAVILAKIELGELGDRAGAEDDDVVQFVVS